VRVKLLLEITAGQGTCLGCRFEEIEAIVARARGGHTVGICFDTCHAHAAGHDLSTEEGYDRVFGDFARVIGLERLLAFHLNDSKTPVGSHVDRHAEIGDGYLGLLPFWRLVNDRRFAATPAVLETPSGPDQLPSFARNLARLRALIGATRPAGPPKSQALPEKKDPRQGRLFDLG
jgi:deoxyribonuclease-4